jgi:hypothetical protein
MSNHLQNSIVNTKRQPTPYLRQHNNLSTLLGHPHEQAEPQDTEPFWQQAPEIVYPCVRFYPELNLYTEDHIYFYYVYSSEMDTTNIVIGRNSRYARTPNTATANPKSQRPREFVAVYLEDNLVGELSLGVLCRFSKLAKITFPKPTQSTQENESTNGGQSEVKVDGTPVGEKADGETWADMAEHSDADKAAAKHVEEEWTTVTKTSHRATPSELSYPKSLAIGVPGVWIQPRLTIAKHILNWMEQNKRSRNNEPLLPLTPAPLPKISLQALVDTYTGVLAYDLTPFPHDLRHEILTRLTQQPTHAEQIQYLYEHLPVKDPILSRMVTSFFEHDDAGHYTVEQRDAIFAYVHEGADDGGDLEVHFNRVKRSRGKKMKREDAMEKLREGFEGFAGPMGEALPAVGDDDKGTTTVTETKGGDKGEVNVQDNKGDNKGKTNVQENKGDDKGKSNVQGTKVDGRQRDRRGPQQRFQAKGGDSKPKGKSP